MKAPLTRRQIERMGARYPRLADMIVERPDPPRRNAVSQWLVDAIETFAHGEDITATALAERSGTSLAATRNAIARGGTKQHMQVVVYDAGTMPTLWERTDAPEMKLDGTACIRRFLSAVNAMPPGRQFVAREIGASSATRSRALKLAVVAGIVREIGQKPWTETVYRRVEK